MHKSKVLLVAFLTGFSTVLFAQDFFAYYTKVEKGEIWEELSRTTEHPDIIVKVGEGQMVFWRGTSYLPYWQTENGIWKVDEMISRSGDGPAERPDATNSFSSVRIISSDEDQIVIHWRYLPQFDQGNPKKNVDHQTIVDEYFTVKPDGSVHRTIKQGSANVDEWLSDKNLIQQRLRLNSQGITLLGTESTSSAAEPSPVIWTATKQGPDNDPVLHLRFDEGEGNTTQEEISASEVVVEGQKAYWKQGVSGTCLAFDSYTSRIGIPGSSASITDEFSLEAWVAVGAYPFNWAPIVQQSEYGESGFYFGVGPSGKITLSLMTGSWNTLVTDYELPLRKWVHVVANFADGVASIYVDGQEIASKTFKGSFQAAKEDFIIGFNSHEQIPGDPVRPDCHECHTPVLFGFDGLIDEVKILDKALTPDEIYDSFLLLSPDQSVIKSPDLQPRELPRGPETGEFMAHYTNLKYYDTWDNLSRFGEHADVVVEFADMPTKFIFWRGMCYVPQVINAENQWYNNQFNESWDAGGSWGEPMSDKQSMRTHVRIIENTPARKVIHWRYAQVQINGTQQNYDDETGWGDWSDWYYFIYPDGVACKRMVHWSGDDPLDHEWQESIGVMGPGQTPENISDVYGETVYFDDLKITKSYNWRDESLDPDAMVPLVLEDDWEFRPLNIQVVNYNSDFKPFTIGDFKGGACYGDFDGRIAPYSNMVVYIHWPLGQLPTDGTRAFKPDRGSSNGYTHLMFKGSHRLGKNWAERVMLEGMSTKSSVELRPLAKSWLNAPKVKDLNGATGGEYDMAQRAYQFLLEEGSEGFDFSIDASDKNPIENLCFVVKNWESQQPVKVRLNDSSLTDKEMQQGTILDTDGSRTLIIYVRLSAQQSVNFTVSGS
jgi:hypothetical protein